MRLPELTRQDLADGALAAAAAAIAVVESVSGNRDGGPLLAYVMSDLLMTLPLAVRRRWPLAVLAWSLLLATAQAAVGFPGSIGTFFGMLVPVYTLAAHRPLRPALIGLLAPVPVIAIDQWLQTGDPWEDLEFITALMAGFWMVGRVVWSRHLLVERLRAQAEQLRTLAAELWQARENEKRAAVLEERARIARDMHDVVAHSVSVMVVHAEAAEALLSEPARAARSLRAIQQTGRGTLSELRHLVGVLRPDEAAALQPSPGLRDADRLIGQMREAGLDVALSISGTPRDLPAGVELAAYRVLQEALTNALRHAGRVRTRALLAYRDGDLVVEVTDDGPAGARQESTPNGHGLVGIRQRVAVYGGDVISGPNGHGFRVRARIPVGDEP